MKEKISYSEYYYLIDALTNKINNNLDLTKIKFIYTFMRGGLPIAVHLSHFLNIEMFTDESNIDFYSQSCGEVLVVDDIADTGKTLDGFQKIFPTATLFYKPRSIVTPTFYIKETTNWIVFPWEKFDEVPNR